MLPQAPVFPTRPHQVVGAGVIHRFSRLMAGGPGELGHRTRRSSAGPRRGLRLGSPSAYASLAASSRTRWICIMVGRSGCITEASSIRAQPIAAPNSPIRAAFVPRDPKRRMSHHNIAITVSAKTRADRPGGSGGGGGGGGPRMTGPCPANIGAIQSHACASPSIGSTVARAGLDLTGRYSCGCSVTTSRDVS